MELHLFYSGIKF